MNYNTIDDVVKIELDTVKSNNATLFIFEKIINTLKLKEFLQ